MSRVLIVVAHPDPTSFTAQWAAASEDGARAAGQEVEVADLYASGFDPVAEDRPQSSVDALVRADAVVFHFPVWWYGPPAILKGWFDRVLAENVFFAPGRVFNAAPLAGKRALFCASAGASVEECGPSGRSGDLRLVLWPLAHALRFCGFRVLEPYLAPGIDAIASPARKILMEAQMAQILRDQSGRMAALDRLPIWASNPDSDFDAAGRLKPGAPVFSPFIRHDDGLD
ncbi:MAG: NAD(P)H-dependent oxidoreductase [Pseudomonadota bacterium]